MNETASQSLKLMPDTPRFNHALQGLVQAVSIWVMQQPWFADLKANDSLTATVSVPFVEAG